MRNHKKSIINNITSKRQNIMSVKRNMTWQITDSRKNITLCSLIIILSLLDITLLTGSMLGIGINSIVGTNNASALTYSTDTDVSFTFNPTLSISLSDTNITIDNLLPGLSSESSPITVSVGSNTPYGYSLFASVGNSTDYDTTSLTHEDSNTGNNAVFTSIATNASLPQLTTDNTWGYTYRTHNTNNVDNEGWSNYNGLPLYSTVDNNTSTNNPALLIDTKNPADNKSIDFKIAAKASTTQASGTYNNVINFYAVGKPQVFYMQETAAIKTKLVNEHDTLTAIDQRDGREYTIAKLKDGKIWMTQNLDLAGGTKLYSETSDVPEGYSESSGNPYYTLPTSGRFEDNKVDYVRNAPYDDERRTVCKASYSAPCYSYYSWRAAVAKNTSGKYSICPSGWRLPSTANNDFATLIERYGGSASEFYNNAGPGTVPNFVLSGIISNVQASGGGTSGYYWTSTYYGSGLYPSGRRLWFTQSSLSANDYQEVRVGLAVRCIVRE